MPNLSLLNMKIKFTDYNLDDFVIREYYLGGEDCYLIFPKHIGVTWDKKNLIFRSSIWTKQGELISAGFKKFFNWGEKPDLTYTPFSLTANGGCQIVSKIDGSTLIISKHNGQLIARTRGTVDAQDLETGSEIPDLMDKYPKVFDNEYLDNGYSVITEWVTPNNRIVIDYPEPDIYLIAIVDHKDYSLLSQSKLDEIALEWDIKRPYTHSYNSVKEMLDDVPTWKEEEGVCVYCNKGQDIRKLKADYYLKLHRLKSELGSYERVVDFYFENDQPSYSDFYSIVVNEIDYEVAERIRGDLSIIVDNMKEVNRIIDNMKEYVKNNKYKSRKEFALDVQQKWGKISRAGMLFTILDKGELKKDQVKKLLWQVSKK